MTHNQETAKMAVDALSVVTVVGTLMEVLPAISALLTVVWMCIRIYETDTVQRLLGKKGGAQDAEHE
jgi:hypothetical protein